MLSQPNFCLPQGVLPDTSHALVVSEEVNLAYARHLFFDCGNAKAAFYYCGKVNRTCKAVFILLCSHQILTFAYNWGPRIVYIVNLRNAKRLSLFQADEKGEVLRREIEVLMSGGVDTERSSVLPMSQSEENLSFGTKDDPDPKYNEEWTICVFQHFIWCMKS